MEVHDPEAASGADLASEALYRQEAERDLDEEEELFNLEENITNPTTYNWEDKYRPRKPRYFNRVHTGYEWNKYNQTHYEYVLDAVIQCRWFNNPFAAPTTLPLKSCKVTRYVKNKPRPRLWIDALMQFNVFYPDLIDKTKAPTYKIVKEPGNDETVLLHFSAGPPYEDIAFRIVNREWEFSHKRYVFCFLLTWFVLTMSTVDSEVVSTVDVFRFGSTSAAM